MRLNRRKTDAMTTEATALGATAARNVRALIAAERVTITELASEIGTTRATASAKLSGKTNFSLHDLAAIGARFGYEPSELVSDAFTLHAEAA